MLKAMLSKSDVVDVYTRTVPVYDLWGQATESKARERALSLAQIRDGETILEVAVGTGLTFRRLLEANPHGRTVGLDLTPAMLEEARRKAARSRLSNYELLQGDAYELRFADGSFDLVVNNYMFDLLPEEDFPRVLAEFRRVLRPSGRIVLVNMTTPQQAIQLVWEWIYRANPAWIGGCRGVELSPVMQRMGFRNIHREISSQLGFPSEIITASVGLAAGPSLAQS